MKISPWYADGNRQTLSEPRPLKISMEEGMYQTQEGIYRVVKSQSSDRLYAKVLIIGDKPRYEYAKGIVTRLRPEHKMTPEQAAKFGELYGVCCNCCRTLSREESKRRGYGPTCADNNGWPYDHNSD